MKPVVVIGNGRSLNEHLARGDFDLLSERAITIATNYICDLYDRTDWRPDHWLFTERDFFTPEVEELGWIKDTFIDPGVTQVHLAVADYYYGSLFYHYPDTDPDLVRLRQRCVIDGHGGQSGDPGIPTEWHLPVFCRYGGTIGPMLQFASELNPPTVGVIGCDLGFTGPEDNDFHGRLASIDGDWAKHDDTLSDVHRIAKMEFEKRNIPIYNVGIGGKLEVYPRMNLAEFLELW